MEVYATIFMIFVSHVLSSFTHTFSSWQKDGRHNPKSTIRRMVYFKDHNNYQENQRDTALEHIMPLIEGNREKIAKDDSCRYPQYEADEVVSSKIPEVKLQRESMHLIDSNAFVSSSEKKHLRLPRKKKTINTNNENVTPSLITTEHSFHNPTDNTEVVLKESDKDKINNLPLMQSSPTEAWANRAKIKYITVRPWNQFCLTCNTLNNLKDNSITYPSSSNTVSEDMCITTTTCYPYPTKRKKTSKPCYPTMKNEPGEDQPWLFYAGPTKIQPQPRIPSRSYPTDKCSTEATICAHKLRNSYLNPKRNNYIDNFLIMRPRKKRRNYFMTSKSKRQLGNLKSALKRYKKDTNRNSFISDRLSLRTHELKNGRINGSEKRRFVLLNKNFCHNKLLYRRNKRRSLNQIENEKNSDLVELFSFGRRDKNHNLEKGIPPCQKSCFYNLTALVNAQTIKPPDYFKQKPTLLLCCEDELQVGYNTTYKSSTPLSTMLGSSETTIGIANMTDSPLPDDLEDLGTSDTLTSSSVTGSSVTGSSVTGSSVTGSLVTGSSVIGSSVTGSLVTGSSVTGSSVTGGLKDSSDRQFGMTGSFPDNGNDNSNTTSSMATVSVPGTTPIVLRMFMQLRTPSSKKTVTGKPKDQLNLKVILKNKDYLIDLNGEKPESELESIPKSLYYLISYKSNDSLEDNSNILHMMKIGSLKKIQPWDKFCPCSGGKLVTISNGVTGLNRQPWVSGCLKCISTNEGNDDINTLLPELNTASTVKSRESSIPIINKPLEEEEYVEDFKTNEARPGRKTLLLIRVPIARGQEYNSNGSWDLVLPFNNTSNNKNIKPRSIFDQFLSYFLKRPTIRPIEHLVNPWEEPWKFRQEKFNLFTTYACATYVPGKKIYNPFTTTNKPPFISKSLLEYIAETCPSCSKNRKDLLFKTTKNQYDDFETNNEFVYEEIGSDSTTCNELPKKKCDDKYVPYVLKLPEVDLNKITSPTTKKVQSMRGLTILRSHGSPKYYIEVPELGTGLRNISVHASSWSLPLVTTPKKSKPSPTRLRNVGHKKPIILYLQPFQINGSNVYLPMGEIHIPDYVKPLESVYTTHTVSYDRKEHNSYPRSKTIVDEFLGKNDSVLPFVLIPAYLAMQPHTSPLTHLLRSTDFPTNANGDKKPLLFGVTGDSSAKIKDKDVELPFLINNLPVEKKLNKVFKQLRYTLPLKKGMVTKPIGLTKKSSRKPLSHRSSIAPSSPSRPSYIILINGMPDALNGFEFPPNKGYFSFMDEKGAITIDPLEDYLLF